MTSYTDAIRESRKGVLLCVHVIPGSSQTTFPDKYNPWRKSIEIKVRAEAKDNKANTEVRDSIARFFQLSSNDVVLMTGKKSREKTVCLKNISVHVVNAKLKGTFHG